VPKCKRLGAFSESAYISMTAYCEKLDNCDAILYQRYYAVLFRVLSD